MNKFKYKQMTLTAFTITNYCILFGLLTCGFITLLYVWVKYPCLANLTMNDILSLNFDIRIVFINVMKLAYRIMVHLILMYMVMFTQVFVVVTTFYLV